MNYGLIFTVKGSKNLIGYNDSNFADTVNNHKSTEVFVFMLAEGPILHQVKQQSIRVLDHERNNEGSMLLYNLAATKNSKMKICTQDESKEKQRSPVKTTLVASELAQKGNLSKH